MDLLSLKDAKEAGLKRYFTGCPCRKGHISERMVSNTDCLACLRAGRKRHYLENIEDQRAKSRMRMAKLYKLDPDRFRLRTMNNYYDCMAKGLPWPWKRGHGKLLAGMREA